MCGIVGFISEANNAIHNVKHGLKTLEYRGYDSAGIAYINSRVVSYTKSKGDVSALFEKLNPELKAKIAIGHTRWATHGEPNKTNAHPHIVKDIAVVHNGIIENYKSLSYGFDLVSQTDTEVIAHLIAKESGSLLERVQCAVKKLKGSYALAVISSKEPDKIVLACKQSPLVIGVCKKGAAIASDMYALIGHASKAIMMEDDETALISSGSVEIFRHGTKINRDPVNIMANAPPNDMSSHETYMHKEIFEQPDIVSRIVSQDIKQLSTIVRRYKLRKKNILLTACGTSYHSCLTAQIFFESVGVPCDVRLASELRYSNRTINEDTFLIAVSQSGETADTLATMRRYKEMGATVMAIVNRDSSIMAREADVVLCTHAGPEISVASTKSFIAQLVFLYGMASAIHDNASLDFQQISNSISEVLKEESRIKQIAQKIYLANSMFFLGRGYGVPVVQEGALKLKEISYIHAEAYPAGELKHGPIALIHKDMPCVFVADRHSIVYDKILSNVEEAKARGAFIVVVASNSDISIDSVADCVLRVPDTHRAIAPFTVSVALQLLAYHVAKFRGCNIDKPRNLAKSVTVE